MNQGEMIAAAERLPELEAEIARLRAALAEIASQSFGVSGMSAAQIEAEFRRMARQAMTP